MSIDPPGYSRHELVPPPAYELAVPLPKHVRVGPHTTPTLVSVEELVDHLKVLNAFSILKGSVLETNGAGASASGIDLDNEAAWTLFVCRAVHRFERWVSCTSEPPKETTLPPLDVLMVWHTYMLNPLAYKEDSVRALPQLAKLGPFPLAAIARAIHPVRFEMQSSVEAQKFFTASTGEPFEPPLETSAEDLIFIACPCCDHSGERYPWPWINEQGTGWAQRRFEAACPTCNRSFDHQAYGVRRFCDEVVKWRELRESGPDATPRFFFAGLLRAYDGERAAARIMDSFLGSNHSPLSADWRAEMLKIADATLRSRSVNPEIAGVSGAALAGRFNWEVSKLVKWATTQLPEQSAIIKRILLHYTFPGLFSVDLIGAVKRQMIFIEQMRDVGWMTAGRFAGADPERFAPLVRSIVRYHAFLDLTSITAHDSVYLVPTLDIDFAWHTHQLRGQVYRADTKRLLGCTLDHEDMVEASALAIAFDQTAQAWMSRFDVPYCVCGCLSPAESTISRGMRRIASILPGSSRSSPSEPEKLDHDLLPSDDVDGSATHPSDHNAVVLDAERRRGREHARDEMLRKRAKDVEKGRAGPWTTVQHRRWEGARGGHTHAFFRSTPGGRDYGFGNSGFVSYCRPGDRPQMRGGHHTDHRHGSHSAGVASASAAAASSSTASADATGAGVSATKS